MNTDTKPQKLLQIVEGPAFGDGKLSIEDDRLFSGLAHLFAIIIWPLKKAESPAVNTHGKEALNMAITWLIVMIPLNIIAGFLPSFLAVIFSLLFSLVGFAALGLAIYGLLLARQGKLLRYPYNLRLIK
jgi:uncharacterized Tic20 family protein